MVDLDGLWDFADPKASEARFRDSVARARSDAESLVIRTQIARALGLQRRFGEANSELDAIETHADALDREGGVRLALERGRVHNSSGDIASAIPCFERALDLATAAGFDALAVDAAHMLGIARPGKDGQRWTRRAIEIAESSDDPKARRWRGSLLNNLGWSRFEAGETVEALQCFEGALAARRESGDVDAVRVARWCVARALRELGRVQEALEAQRALEREYSRDGRPSGFVHEELGECMLLLGRAADAPEHFRAAYRELSRDAWLVEREPERLERLRRLGEGTG